MHDVFISYSTKDMTQAETIRDVLEKNGIPCWMAPRDIPGGSNYAREIPVAIRACQVFVLVMSENAQASNWVVKELDNAVNCGKIIIPLMLEDCPLNDEFNFLLTGAQRYAAYQKSAEVLNTLVERIKAVTKPKVEPAPRVEAEPQPPVKQADAKPKQAAAREEAPRKAAAAPKPAAAPVVQQAKPQKPKKVKEKIPFVFGKAEKMALLGIPGMALLTLLGYLMGNNLYMATTYSLQYGFGDVILHSSDYPVMAFAAALALLLGVILWWEWVRFRNREQAENPDAPICPSCGGDQLRFSTFRTRRMTWAERATLLLVPVCMVANMFVYPVVVLTLASVLGVYISTILGNISMSITFCGMMQGLAIGLWLSNLLVRRMRRKKGLRSTVCRCGGCRATFLPVRK